MHGLPLAQEEVFVDYLLFMQGAPQKRPNFSRFASFENEYVVAYIILVPTVSNRLLPISSRLTPVPPILSVAFLGLLEAVTICFDTLARFQEALQRYLP